MATVLVGLVVLGLVALALRSVMQSKKKGAGCGCGCPGCDKGGCGQRPEK